MQKKYSRRQLHSIYARYAREKGWIDNPIAVEAWVDLWFCHGSNAVDDAILLHESANPTAHSSRGRIIMLAIGCVALIVLAI